LQLLEREEVLPTDDDPHYLIPPDPPAASTGAAAGGAQDNAYDRFHPTDSAALGGPPMPMSTLLQPLPIPSPSSATYRTIGGNTGDAVVLVQRWYRSDRTLGPRVEVALQGTMVVRGYVLSRPLSSPLSCPLSSPLSI